MNTQTRVTASKKRTGVLMGKLDKSKKSRVKFTTRPKGVYKKTFVELPGMKGCLNGMVHDEHFKTTPVEKAVPILERAKETFQLMITTLSAARHLRSRIVGVESLTCESFGPPATLNEYMKATESVAHLISTEVQLLMTDIGSLPDVPSNH